MPLRENGVIPLDGDVTPIHDSLLLHVRQVTSLARLIYRTYNIP